MNELNQKLCQLIAEASQYPLKSLERQQRISEVHRLVMKSGKLWREGSSYYTDALQEMWEYCCQHPETYDPTVKQVITWLDDYLKKRLRRYRDARYRQQQRLLVVLESEKGKITDAVDTLSAPPDIQPTLDIWQATLDWARTDPDGTLRRTIFRKRPAINGRALILRRLPPDTPWADIAAEFKLNPAEAKDLPKFYHRKCLPLLRKFALSQGFIEELNNRGQAGRQKKTQTSRMRKAS
ncbi:MAG: sigma-70 family RNA polymerase sigma factor [Leptolyngbyaceae cyanobacterium MO_188.B28]|nr:sigma-70 family RNA polymerase sigma factor [Leptolyngbyaceae cyanobacterium MO_188.B28]